MINLEHPLLLLLLIPIVWCLFKCKEKLKTINFVHVELFSFKKRWINFELLLKITLLTLLVIALSSPIKFDQTHPNNRDGKDIVLAIDASGSMSSSGMDSETLKSRFEIVKELAIEFINERYEENFGVVYFADFAFIASAITYEKEPLSEMIGYLSQGMAGQNTAIGDAISLSIRAFKTSKSKSKVIILLSDGEQNSGKVSVEDAVKKAKSQNILIYTIGLSDEVNVELLKKIAQESGGEYFQANTKEDL
ncbi:MAG: VWA domain-containing protein, partial [Campylobacterota bacterium]|nr:VWA domain-containing protein [Campylobacterota bacterium]